MALKPSAAVDNDQLIPEVDMGAAAADSSAPTVRATVVQASPVYNDTPATLDLGEIARAKFNFDAVGHYARPEVLSLIVKDDPLKPVTFASASAKTQVPHKS